MIKSFADKETEKVWKDGKSKKWSMSIQRVAFRKLLMINAAKRIDDLRIPPGNKLHKLKGDLDGYWSIKINDQWRIIFEWEEHEALNIEIIDYH